MTTGYRLRNEWFDPKESLNEHVRSDCGYADPHPQWSVCRQGKRPYAGLKQKTAIAQVLKDEGYIKDFAPAELDGKPAIEVTLKYFQGAPVIDYVKRVSRPGLHL